MKNLILVVIGNLDSGGAERHLLQVLPNLNNEKFNFKIYATSHRGKLATEMENSGVEVISPPAQWLKKLGKIGKTFSYIISFIKLNYFIIRRNPKVVHCFLPGAYLLGSIPAILYRKKLIMSRRSLNNYQSKHRLLTKIEHNLHQYLILGIGNSQIVGEQLQNEGIPKHKTKLIYNGVDTDKFKPVEKQKNSNELRLIIVANLFPYKGHTDLLEALSIIKNQLPSNWKLTCVGRDQGILSSLKQKAENLNLNKNIEWVGEQNNIPALLAQTDIGILCSHEEGFSNSILEAMACGLPMIVTDVGGNTDAVIDNENGFVVPAKSPEKLAEAILMLANNSELRTKMGKANRLRIEDKFSLERCVENYKLLYQEVLSNGIIC